MLNPEQSSSNAFYFGLAILSHLLWGSYPVFARYLTKVCNLPTISLVGLGNFPMLFIGWKVITENRLPKLDDMSLWITAICVTIRSLCNIGSSSLVSAVSVQLITLSTPFVVSILNYLVLKERLPKYTIPVMLASTVGSMMMLEGDPQSKDSSWGIFLAIFGTIMQGAYMVGVKVVTSKSKMSGSDLLFFVTLPSVIMTPFLSFPLGEDWTTYIKMDGYGWFMFFLFAMIRLMAHMAQIKSIEKLGAPMVSTLMPSRMASAVLMSVMIMSEGLGSLQQIFGAILVFATVSFYLWINHDAKQ